MHMRLFVTAVFMTALSFINPASAAAQNPAIGIVTEIEGAATLRHDGAAVVSALKKGDAVLLNDKVDIAKDAKAKIVFKDETEIQLAGAGSIVVDKFFYDPENAKAGSASFNILHAAFSYIGGKLEKDKDSDVQVHIDFGSIGIRGTRLIRGMKDGQCWIYLQEGAITVHNDGGSVDLKPGEGTKMSAKDKAPLAAAQWQDSDTLWLRTELGLN